MAPPICPLLGHRIGCAAMACDPAQGNGELPECLRHRCDVVVEAGRQIEMQHLAAAAPLRLEQGHPRPLTFQTKFGDVNERDARAALWLIGEANHRVGLGKVLRHPVAQGGHKIERAAWAYSHTGDDEISHCLSCPQSRWRLKYHHNDTDRSRR